MHDDYDITRFNITRFDITRFRNLQLRARYNDVFSGNRVLKFMAAIWVLNIVLTSLQWVGISILFF